MNEIVNVLWKYCCGVAAGVFAQYTCRHSWNLRLRLTESDKHRFAAQVYHPCPPLFTLSRHSSIADITSFSSVIAVRMSMPLN